MSSGYVELELIGEGTYGQVYRASHARPDGATEHVAVKRLRMENETEGFPMTAIREIRILQELRHPNVVRLIEVVASEADGIRIVYEYADHDLALIDKECGHGVSVVYHCDTCGREAPRSRIRIVEV